MTNEEAIVFMDNLMICINEHPVVADWLVEIANRKTEPQKIGYCNECKWFRDKQVCGRCRSKNMYAPKDESQTDVVALDKATLMDYFINSVNENDEPVWTERHIDEILKDFDVVPKTKPQMEELQFVKQCHKPSSLYYRCYCNESKNDEYCNGCEFWYEPQKDNIKAIKDLQEYCGIKQEPTLSEMFNDEPQTVDMFALDMAIAKCKAQHNNCKHCDKKCVWRDGVNNERS